MLVYQRVYPIVGGYSCVDTYQLVQDFATIHSISYDRILIYSNIVDDCEILHQLKTVVNIPLFCWGFNHPRWWCRISQPSTVVIGVICYIPTYYPSIHRKIPSQYGLHHWREE